MAKREGAGGIEIEQDLEFQRRSWRVQRAGWVMMLLIIIAALLGVFGNGPLSDASVTDGALRVDYQRFVRLDSPENIDFNVASSGLADSTITLWIDRDWLSQHDVRGIVPAPRASSVAGDRVLYTFAAAPMARSSTIEMQIETKGYGRMKGKAGIVGGPQVSFTQLSYF